MANHLRHILSDNAHPDTAPAWLAVIVVLLVLLAIKRALWPQWLALRESWLSRRRHQSTMLARKRKEREERQGRY